MLLHILAGIGYGRKTSRHKICLALQDLAVLLNEKSLVESRKVIPSVPVSSMVCMLPFFCAAKI